MGKMIFKQVKNAGCKTVLIGDDEFGQDITVYSLLEFVNQIVC